MLLRACYFLISILLAGCRGEQSPTETVSFNRDVAPILSAHCASCHRPGEAAPFSLLTFDDARARDSQIVEVTSSRFMPPWLPEAGHEKFADERRLSDSQIELLKRWVDEGSPEGDVSEASPAPQFTSGWQMGEPDLILESLPFMLDAEGKDRFRNFVLTVPENQIVGKNPPPLQGGARGGFFDAADTKPAPPLTPPRSTGEGDFNHWVRAVELRPLVPRVTHHARLGIDASGESARRDAADPEEGYEGMAWGADPEGQLITWTPGMQPDKGTTDAAWQLTPAMNLVLHTHLQPSGKSEMVSFRVGFYFADKPPTVHPMILRIGSRDIDIPPGETSYTFRDTYELPIAVDASFIFPHAHSLCGEILVQAELPDGETRTLIAIKRFDENWHDKYRFAKPVRLPRGTRLTTEFTYDNSSENIRNTHNPPERVVYGSNSSDEMADVYLQVIPVDPNQLAVLEEHYDQYDLKSKIVGYRKTLELHPDDPWSHEALASCYLAIREPQLAIEQLEGTDSTQAKVILGVAHLADGDATTAEKVFREVLTIDEKLPIAWLGLGQALVKSQLGGEGETALRQATKLAPRMTVARLDLIDLLIAEERWKDAIVACEDAIRSDPTAYQPHLKLANLLARERRYDESLEHFAAARELAPFVYSPESSLAILCYQFGDEQKADELLRTALTQDPNDPVPYCFLGQIARRNGKFPDARQHLQKSLDLPLPTTWPASHVRQFLTLVYTEQLQLAQAFEDTNLAKSAATAWLKLDPNNEALKKLVHDIDR